MPEDYGKFFQEGEADSSTSEARPFSHDEMVTCEACLRTSPPTRMNCFYCGAVLPLTEKSAALRKPSLRQPEKWETGYNVIVRAPVAATEELKREVAALLRLEREDAARILEAREPLPLARVATREEAALLEERLCAHGLNLFVVSDLELAAEKPGRRRVRGFEMTDDSLMAFASGSEEVWRAPWSDIRLLVTGRMVVRRVEMEERRKKRGTGSEMVKAREMTGDVLLLDLYTGARDGGWRVASDSFDYSCLGNRKTLIASENFMTLARVICERAPHAVHHDAYKEMRRALAPVWPPEERTESKGLRRERPGKFNIEAVMTSDNEMQFTRYSRLCHYLNTEGDGL